MLHGGFKRLLENPELYDQCASTVASATYARFLHALHGYFQNSVYLGIRIP